MPAGFALANTTGPGSKLIRKCMRPTSDGANNTGSKSRRPLADGGLQIARSRFKTAAGIVLGNTG